MQEKTGVQSLGTTVSTVLLRAQASPTICRVTSEPTRPPGGMREQEVHRETWMGKYSLL